MQHGGSKVARILDLHSFMSAYPKIQTLRLSKFGCKTQGLDAITAGAWRCKPLRSKHVDPLEPHCFSWTQEGKTISTCPRALPGDILCAVDFLSSETWIIIRKNRSRRVWELVGPALIADAHTTSRSKKASLAKSRGAVLPLKPSRRTFDSWFKSEDLMVLRLYNLAYHNGQLSLGEQKNFLSYPKARSGSSSYRVEQVSSLWRSLFLAKRRKVASIKRNKPWP